LKDSDESPTEVQLTDNDSLDVGYVTNTVWFQDGYYYILFTEVNKKSQLETAIYLQAIKIDDASLRYTTAIKVAKLSNPPGTSTPSGGPNKSEKSTKITVFWKDFDSKSLKQAVVTIADGSVLKAVTLVTDTEKVGYFSSGLISSASTSGIVLDKQELKAQSTSSSLIVFLNGDTKNAKKFDLEIPKGYAAPFIRSFDKGDGFIVIGQFLGEKDAIFAMKSFKTDGTAQGASKTIITTKEAVQFFRDASGSIWVGYVNFDTSNGNTEKAYLGKLSV
jgi:hypothetical protein